MKTSLAWVATSDKRFCKRYGYSSEEFKAWEVQWLQTKRVRDYGLVRGGDGGIEGMLAARQRGHKAWVAGIREPVLGAGSS